MADGANRDAGAVHAAIPHDSAHKHVSGEALYTDDMPEPPGLLHAWILTSPRAHARIVAIDTGKAAAQPGAVVLTAADLQGRNDVGPIFPGEPILADGIVEYIGEPVLAVAAASIKAARAAAQLAKVEYADLPAVLSIEEAWARQSFVSPPHALARGDAAAALAKAPRRLAGELRIGGQDHFYLEGQVAMAVPQEDGDMLVHASTQHPTEMQKMVARVLGRPMQRRHGRGAAHGRRVRRQGDAAGHLRLHRRGAGAQGRAAGQAAARPRRRHDDHGQAPRFPGALRCRLRRRRTPDRAGHGARGARRPCRGPVAGDRRSRAVPRRQLLFPSRRADRRLSAARPTRSRTRRSAASAARRECSRSSM